MKWLVGIIILILLIVSVRFRKLAGSLVLLGIVVGLLLWQYQEHEKNKSKNRISPSELVLKNITFKPSNSHYEMTGRIINNSQTFTLNGVQLKITAKECANNNNDCIIILEKNEYVYVHIPPKQARDFRKEVSFYSNQIIEGKLVWNYSVGFAESE
ncbi:hypothetical protein [Nitrosomonas communis]|uniref:Uncharacterized protein n=1 Tax=Nitrosomonas communis TaxID=44574 RepID=A0A1H2YFN7_9PROT|nr:hypothetical protein [Nitrosomonas communis]SDX04012.1 hypothetical protein SAMN05421882_105110 [Nitrosomonas communis]